MYKSFFCPNKFACILCHIEVASFSIQRDFTVGPASSLLYFIFYICSKFSKQFQLCFCSLVDLMFSIWCYLQQDWAVYGQSRALFLSISSQQKMTRGVVGDKWSFRILWLCAIGSAVGRFVLTMLILKLIKKKMKKEKKKRLLVLKAPQLHFYFKSTLSSNILDCTCLPNLITSTVLLA